jgi:hypothetical protein
MEVLPLTGGERPPFPVLADRLRAGGRAVVRRHTWARVAEAHEAAYRAFLARRRR